MSDDGLSFNIQQGGGLSKEKEAWLEKYAEFQQPFNPFAREDFDKGVLRLADLERRVEPDYFMRKYGNPEKSVPPDPTATKDLLVLTFMLVDEDSDEPILDKAVNKPMAIEYKVTFPKDNLFWKTFTTTAFFKTLKELGYEIQESQFAIAGKFLKPLKEQALAGQGIYALAEITINESSGDSGKEVRKYPNVKDHKMHKPGLKKHVEANKKRLEEVAQKAAAPA